MKPVLSVLASIVLFSLACAAPAVECDEDEVEVDGECEPSDGLFGDADTDTDADADADFNVEVEWVPTSGDVRWNVAASGETTIVALYIIDNGDPTFEGCDLEDEGGLESLGNLWCGIWSEAHDRFTVVDGTNDLGGTTQFIRLAEESDYSQQANNESTLFTADYLDSYNYYTWLAEVEGPDGSGCSADGYDPDFFSSVCP
jgi:hypothetical protein